MYKDIFKRLHIGAYCLSKNARTEEHVRELSECGIDLLFSVNNDRALLDLLAKYGIGAVVSGIVPGWFGADGKNAGRMHEINREEAYTERIGAFSDHGAIVGIDIGDEPSALDFPHIGRVSERLCELLPNKLLYLNIYPSYGMLASAGKEQARRELGTETYRDYLLAYAENVKLPYLSIDHYPYSSSIESFLSDLSAASEVCREYALPLMTVLQVNSHVEGVFLSTEQIRLQAWCALAHGARVISWACYGKGWWHNNVLDKDGRKTEQYEKLKRVNRELKEFSAIYDGYAYSKTSVLRAKESITTPLGEVLAESDVLIGEFTAGGGAHALLCVPLDFDNAARIELCSPPQRLAYHAPVDDIRVSEGGTTYFLGNYPVFIYAK